MNLARQTLVVMAVTTMTWAVGCAGHDGGSQADASGTERDGVIAKRKPGIPCDELPAGSKVKCGPGGDDSPPDPPGGASPAALPTAHVVGDATSSPAAPLTCRSVAGVSGTWLPTSAAQALGAPLRDQFCELVWMAVGGSQPDMNALNNSYPGVVFTPDPTCTDTVCAGATEAVNGLTDWGGPEGGATCNACLDGVAVGRAVNGTLYISLPPSWVQPSDTVQGVERPYGGGIVQSFWTAYSVTFPANTQWLRVTTSNRTSNQANGVLYMMPPPGH